MSRPPFMDRFAKGIWRGLTHQDPPWAAGDYPNLLATAETMLAARQKRFPDLVRAGKMDAAAAQAELETFAVIVADWRWIITGEGERAHLATLAARQAALDTSIDTIAEIAGEAGGFTRALALQAQHVIALRWHLDPESEVHLFAALTHQIRADLAHNQADGNAPAPLRSAA